MVKKKTTPKKVVKVKLGRPTEYTFEKAKNICAWIADGKSLAEYCRQPDTPTKQTVYYWLQDHKQFLDLYTYARDVQADILVDQMLEIADDGQNDWIERRDAEGAIIGWRENGESVNRSRLRLDARKWVAAKMKPRKYGINQIDVTSGGETIRSIGFDVLTKPNDEE